MFFIFFLLSGVDGGKYIQTKFKRAAYLELIYIFD